VQQDGYTVGAGYEYVKDALGSAFYSYANLLSVVLDEDGQDVTSRIYAEHILLWGRLGPREDDKDDVSTQSEH
jgi:hypothetical protein